VGVFSRKKNRGGEATDRWGPDHCAGSLNQIKPSQNNSNKFEFKSNLFKFHLIQIGHF
jgi:hypothetical protein